MSNSDCAEVGYGKPPKKHRFSKENQPRRRQKKAPKSLSNNLHAHIVAALGEDVSISENGRAKKVKASEVLAKMLVKQGISGSVTDKMKLVKFLGSAGEFDWDKIRAELNEEYTLDLERERERYDELLALCRELDAAALELDARLTFVSGAFLTAEAKCSCAVFDDCPGVASTIRTWDAELAVDGSGQFSQPTHEQQMGWAPSTMRGPQGGGQANAVPTKNGNDTPVDDLSEGMIGND